MSTKQTSTTEPRPDAQDEEDTLVPDRKIRDELQVTSTTTDRWDKEPRMHALGWPPKVKILNLNYRSGNKYKKFKRNLFALANKQRSASK